MGNFLVWVVWVVAAFACLGSGAAVVSFSNPFYSRARADREPRLARQSSTCCSRPSSSPRRRCSSTRAP